jgi:L-aspartate oxidase
MIGDSETIPVHHSPIVVVGSGVAGLSVALGLRECTLLTETALGAGGSSQWAQGGVAVAVAADDSPAAHAADTLRVAAGLGDSEVVRVLTEEGPEAIAELIELGARFDHDVDGQIVLGREAGHSARRIVHANGDATGAEVIRALVEAVRTAPGIDVGEGVVVIDLIRRGDRVAGVIALREGRLEAHLADAVVLATGGYAHTYQRTTTPREVIGAGIAMAARAGADLADMEFVQFHPTALAVAGVDQMPLLTEALRGEGAILVDELGERYMLEEHPDAELAPRDVVARATYRQLQAGHTPFLDAREAVGEIFPERFPTVFALAQRHGLDPRIDLLPVSPAAHYCMGGIAVGVDGRSSLDGLWAVGETTSSGLHGANRLASNSLLEGLVMGRRVAAGMAASARSASVPASETLSLPADLAELGDGGIGGNAAVEAEIRALLWAHAGVERDESGLQVALHRVEALGDVARCALRSRTLHYIATEILTAALARCESRGAHFRSDLPLSDPATGVRRIVPPLRVPVDPWLDGANELVAAHVVMA